MAEDELARFCVVRRLGAAADRPGLDRFRLGLAFMASSQRGQPELDFEAEEAAILAAVGESRVDLVVDDTGDPEQLIPSATLAVQDLADRIHKRRRAQGTDRPRTAT